MIYSSQFNCVTPKERRKKDTAPKIPAPKIFLIYRPPPIHMGIPLISPTPVWILSAYW
jgi:hypothetical protein